MSAHSFFPPSGAKAWRKCAAWPVMNSRYPQEDTEESKEGTAAHWVAWGVHAGQEMREGMVAPNGVIVTLEMLDGAEMLVAEINKLKDPKIEQTVIIPRVHANCFGTPDVWSFNRDTMLLTVIDYKFGTASLMSTRTSKSLTMLLAYLRRLKNTACLMNM